MKGTEPLHRSRRAPHQHNKLLTLQAVGDWLCAFVGLSLGYWLRFHTPMRDVGVPAADVSFSLYLPLIVVGSTLLIFTFAYLGLYNWKLILRPRKYSVIVVKGVFFWCFVFLGVSLALKYHPPISRIFVATGTVTILAVFLLWRGGLHYLLQHLNYAHRLVQRVAVLGWNEDAITLMRSIRHNRNHPYESVGLVLPPGEAQDVPDAATPVLGSLAELERLITDHALDILVVTDLDLSKRQLMGVSAMCERLYVDLKMTPSMFQIFVAGLQLQSISGIPILGVEQLRATKPFNQAIKRLVDALGALAGLLFSIPVLPVLALLIKAQSKGPILFKQVRTGRDGVSFTMYKLRSMQTNAEAETGAVWTQKNDDRLIPIGAFMRRWNLDELPQFWNVLKGDMSLVGPRPERPELIETFEKEIDHYNPRHCVRPGMSGWAQVSGLRGNTSLEERIRYDLYYIENWSLMLDFQIMFMTFVNRENAY